MSVALRLILPALCLSACAAQPVGQSQPVKAETDHIETGDRLTTSMAQAQARIVDIERRSGGRLGVALRDPAGRVLLSHRGDERFAMCSTFKTLLAGMVLSDAEGIDPGERLTFDPAAVEGHAPYTRTRLGEGWMTVAAAAESIVTVSDNTAANLLLDKVGGPHALTKWIRARGDEITRLDRREPDLNENGVGDPRDTTTPLAFGETYRRLLSDDESRGEDKRDMLASWMIASTTGLNRVRAGLPADWLVGDKTGYCAGQGAVEINDVAIFDPAVSGQGKGGWYTLAFFLDRPREAGAFADALGAEVGELAAEVVRSTN